MNEIEWPMEVVLMPKANQLDMEDEEDSEDEDSFSAIGFEQGFAAESEEVESFEQLHELLTSTYKNYVIMDNDLREQYNEWREYEGK